MSRTPLFLLVALCLSACGPQPQTGADRWIAGALQTSEQAMHSGNYPVAEVALQSSLQPQTFSQLSDGMQHLVATRYAQAAEYNQHYAAALSAWRQATTTYAATPADWGHRFAADAYSADPRDAVDVLAHLQQHPGDLGGDLSVDDMRGIAQTLGAGEQPAHARLSLYRLLDGRRWRPRLNDGDASDLWLDMAVAFAEAGERPAAGRYAARISDPYALAMLRADRRFDGLGPPDRVEGLAEAELARAHGPRPMFGMVFAAQPLSAAYAQLALGRPQAALDELDAAVRPSSRVVGLRNNAGALTARRATALVALGRAPEALAMLSQWDDCSCGLRLERAEILVKAGLGREAVALVARGLPPGANPVGQAEFARLGVCGFAASGRPDRARMLLADVGAGRNQVGLQRYEALLCLDDQAAARAEFIARLQDPFTRPAALLLAQTFQDGPTLPFQAQLRQRHAQVIADPQVAAVIDNVGHRNAYALNSRPGLL